MVRKRLNRKEFRKEFVRKVPNRSGIYELLDSELKTVYVGKSKHLRDRLLRQFSKFKGKAKYFRVRFMPPKAAEKVENEIIRKKKPKYNRRLW